MIFLTTVEVSVRLVYTWGKIEIIDTEENKNGNKNDKNNINKNDNKNGNKNNNNNISGIRLVSTMVR